MSMRPPDRRRDGTHRNWLPMLACMVHAIVACSGSAPSQATDGGNGSCATATGEIATLCRTDEARALAKAGDTQGAIARCEKVAMGPWRGECRFAVAEILAPTNIQAAVNLCHRAEQFQGNCTHHTLWARVARPLGVRPDDPAAQRAVDAFAATFNLQLQYMPPPPQRPVPARSEWLDQERQIRARAWFDVYYGSGSADPAAARAASDTDGPAARSAFAWEAVRLALAAPSSKGGLLGIVSFL